MNWFSLQFACLKDKWRNLRGMPSGRGCRERAVIPLKKSQQIPKLDNKPTAVGDVVKDFADVIVDAKPLAMVAESPQIAPSKRLEAKLVFQLHCESYDCF